MSINVNVWTSGYDFIDGRSKFRENTVNPAILRLQGLPYFLSISQE